MTPPSHKHRILLRSSDHYLHGLLSISTDCKSVTVEDTVRALAKEVGLITAFKLAQYPDIENELLRIDEVLLKFDSRHDHLFRRWSLICVKTL